MTIKWLSRRTLLGSSSLLAGAGLFGSKAAGQATSAVATVSIQLQPTVAALAQTGLAALPTTLALLSKLGLSPALLAALTNLQPGIQAGGAIKHKGLVRRVRNPAMIKSMKNPHFVPQGNPFTAVEQASYVPRAAHGGGV